MLQSLHKTTVTCIGCFEPFPPVSSFGLRSRAPTCSSSILLLDLLQLSPFSRFGSHHMFTLTRPHPHQLTDQVRPFGKSNIFQVPNRWGCLPKPHTSLPRYPPSYFFMPAIALVFKIQIFNFPNGKAPTLVQPHTPLISPFPQ